MQLGGPHAAAGARARRVDGDGSRVVRKPHATRFHAQLLVPPAAAQASSQEDATCSFQRTIIRRVAPSPTSRHLSPTPVMRTSAPLHPRSRVVFRAAAAPPALPVVGPTTYKYRYFTKRGNVVSVVVTHGPQAARVEIFLEGKGLDGASPAPQLHWGMYRASANQWYHPKESVPGGSYLDTESRGMRSSMGWDFEGQCWRTGLDVPAKLLPVHLAFLFFDNSTGTYDGPARSKAFSVPLGMSAGEGATLGASVVYASPPGARPEDTTCCVNFAVFSRHASAVYLCLARVQPDVPGSTSLQGTGVLEIALDPVTNRTGDVWHVCVHGLRNIGLMCYGWRADGDATWETGGRFHPGFILADPYAPLVVPVRLPEAAYTGAPRIPPRYDVMRPVLLASLASFTQTFRWNGAYKPLGPDGRPVHRCLEEEVLLELDIQNFTNGPEAEKSVRPGHRGKFLGVLDRLQDIVGSGATSVVLSPCTLTAAGTGPWGRHPTSFLAPDPGLAVHGVMTAALEFKMMVAALHRAGLGVILSVEYSLTGEGADAAEGGLQGLRGLDAQLYYRPLQDRSNVLAAGHPVVRHLVMTSLHHWALDCCVDGFAFVHAENLAQDKFGAVLDNPPLAEDIATDPVLRDLKLIALAGNGHLLPRSGVRGFPHWGVWQQVNDRYRDSLHAYLGHNNAGLLSDVATRITGSADLFAPQWEGLPGSLAAGRRAAFGVNALTPPGDKSLLKMLGSDQDLDRAEIKARTMLLALLTGAGTPMISATTLSRKGLWRFAAVLSSLRKQHLTTFNPPLSFVAPEGGEPPKPVREITWHSAIPGGEVDWSNASGGAAPTNVIAYSLRDPHTRSTFFVALNPYPGEMSVALPSAGFGASWRRLVDTALMPPQDIDLQGPMLPPGSGTYTLQAHAGILLVVVQAAGGAGQGMGAGGSMGMGMGTGPQGGGPPPLRYG